jgi:phytoene dehydrogenase-like protein
VSTAAAEFDVVVIGAGHNGLVCGAYLARAGLEVCVVEKRLEAGGGLTTEEATLPGYYHNLHSVFHDAAELMPAMKDLELERHHVAYVRPPVQVGLALRDGRAALAYDEVERTCAAIAALSPPDAEAYRRVNERYREFVEAIVVPALYSPPVPPSHATGALEGSAEGLEWLRLSRASPADVACQLFEDEGVRALVLFQLAIPRGVVSDYAGLGMLVPLVVTQVERSHLCVGGSHALAHGLWRALLRAGGVVRGVHEVSRVLVEGGRAVGVEIAGGGVIRARRAVVSAVGFRQTLLRLVGAERLPDGARAAAERFRLDEYSIFSVHLALEEPPRYRAAAFAPDLDRALKVGVGFDGPADFARLWTDVRAGRLPEPAMYCAAPTVHDPTQAPPGKHTAFLWQPAPFRLGGDPGAWDREREGYADLLLERWREAAPNLDARNVKKRFVQTPLDIARKLASMEDGGVFLGRSTLDQIEYFRPAPGLSQYRGPLKGLYLAGGCTHPGGGILGAAGYNAAAAVAEDLGVPRWWLGEGGPAR